MSPMLLTFLVAAFSASCLAPVIGWICTRLNIVDRPDGNRKLHTTVVPLTGGPTLFLTILIAIAATLWYDADVLKQSRGDFRFLIFLTFSAAVLVLVGLLDDRFGLRGRQKLFGQMIAAFIMLPSGIVIEQVELFGIPLEFGVFSSLVTLFWILGAINALNLIDGVDGLASTTGIVLSLSVAAVTMIMQGRPDGLLISLALAGGLVGFLIYNFPPAKMFLGDSGSMLIGLVLGCVALKCSVKQYAAVALIMPTAIWAIPIFDVAMAIVRRRLTGRSIYATDRGHLHHCLVRKGHTGARLLVVVATLCAITGAGAIASALFQNEWLALIAVVTALSLLVLSRSFGHAEMTLLGNRCRRIVATIFRPREGRPVHHEQVRLQGHHEWTHLWEMLTAIAEERQLANVELMVNMPSVGEAYHASWRAHSNGEAHEIWRIEMPLIVDSTRVGHIKLAGLAAGEFSDWFMMLGKSLQPFESDLERFVQQIRRKPSSTTTGPVLVPPLVSEQLVT
jgi:UDP-GlcNAc:undecaprenyl-phosphate GlcNAc-1-phosphate transferase